MRDYICIGPVPCDEACEQLGPNYNPVKSKKESQAYINQLRRVYGDEPVGCRLLVKSFPHDFGSYHEVVCQYDIDNEEATNYAFEVESGCEEWDEEAKKEVRKIAKSKWVNE